LESESIAYLGVSPSSQALLRRPGGFEGLVPIEVGTDRDRLAVPDLGHERQGRYRFDAAGLAARLAAAATAGRPKRPWPRKTVCCPPINACDIVLGGRRELEGCKQLSKLGGEV
jgi:hypothetical protein